MTTHEPDGRFDGTDFGPMVRAAALATTLAVAMKLGTALVMAAQRQATVEVRLYLGVVPYLAFLMSRPPYLVIATTSTLIMAVTVTLAYVVSLLRYRRRQYVAGWLAGPMAVVNVLMVDSVRHVIDPPYLLWRITRWSVLCLVIGVLLTAVWLCVMRPWAATDTLPDVAPDQPDGSQGDSPGDRNSL
jgi:hypothetical protein